jgi:hypothetical protein
MFLDKYLNKKGFTALLIGGILAVMIGAVLIVISYTVINAIFTTSATSVATPANSSLNASMYANLANITAALNIAGISLIVVGISAIIYMLIGLGGVSGGRR